MLHKTREFAHGRQSQEVYHPIQAVAFAICRLTFPSYMEKLSIRKHILINFQLPGDIARQEQCSKVANISLSEIYRRFWNFQKRELISPISIVRCSPLIHIGKIPQSSICDKLETCFIVLTSGTCMCSNC